MGNYGSFLWCNKQMNVECDSGFISLQPSVEGLWAMKALEHAEVYFNVSVGVLYAF